MSIVKYFLNDEEGPEFEVENGHVPVWKDVIFYHEPGLTRKFIVDRIVHRIYQVNSAVERFDVMIKETPLYWNSGVKEMKIITVSVRSSIAVQKYQHLHIDSLLRSRRARHLGLSSIN